MLTEAQKYAAMASYLGVGIPTGSRKWNKIRCPFHDDENASASWSIGFHCFACGVRYSNIVWLLTEQEGLTYGEAEQRAVELSGGADEVLRSSPGGRTLPGMAGEARDLTGNSPRVQARLRTAIPRF